MVIKDISHILFIYRSVIFNKIEDSLVKIINPEESVSDVATFNLIQLNIIKI